MSDSFVIKKGQRRSAVLFYSTVHVFYKMCPVSKSFTMHCNANRPQAQYGFWRYLFIILLQTILKFCWRNKHCTGESREYIVLYRVINCPGHRYYYQPEKIPGPGPSTKYLINTRWSVTPVWTDRSPNDTKQTQGNIISPGLSCHSGLGLGLSTQYQSSSNG